MTKEELKAFNTVIKTLKKKCNNVCPMCPLWEVCQDFGFKPHKVVKDIKKCLTNTP